jgi:hypothetical protein
MELQVIRHRTSSDYFKDFFTEDTAAAYSYQLQRMFESGAAKEGDYFLVKDDGKPYLQAEIYRNNTRRIWEKTPVISPKAVPEKNRNYEALKLVFEFLKSDEFYFSPADRLEIVISEQTEFSNELKALSNEFGYEVMGECQKFNMKIKKSKGIKIHEGINFTPFTDLKPEERFKIVYENNIIGRYLDNADPALIYQDYLDEGYFSEELWQAIYFEHELSGFIMPVFTSGFKNKICLLNYCIINKEHGKMISEAIVMKTINIASDLNIENLEFILIASDKDLIYLLDKTGGEKGDSFMRYIKK